MVDRRHGYASRVAIGWRDDGHLLYFSWLVLDVHDIREALALLEHR